MPRETVGAGAASQKLKSVRHERLIRQPVFLNQWADLTNRQFDFYRRYVVSWQQFAGVTLDVLLLAAVLWIPVVVVQRSGNPRWIRILKWCTLVGLMTPLNIVRKSDEVRAFASSPGLQALPLKVLIVVLGVGVGIVLLWKWEESRLE